MKKEATAWRCLLGFNKLKKELSQLAVNGEKCSRTVDVTETMLHDGSTTRRKNTAALEQCPKQAVQNGKHPSSALLVTRVPQHEQLTFTNESRWGLKKGEQRCQISNFKMWLAPATSTTARKRINAQFPIYFFSSSKKTRRPFSCEKSRRLPRLSTPTSCNECLPLVTSL